ncbi:MAG: S-methyl-5'-thioadenosine phosphorylase [Candidatus Omnitrophota bacterium]|nr:S-methyl-5'-thioadenosine phosphorylase [Candidatus Omnitrophota bacterium]
MAKVGIIGGSGLYEIEGIANLKELEIWDTPFGSPSDHFMGGTLDGVDVVFVARHGRGHHIPPSKVNYRANIFEMKRLGVDAIISVSACGSLREEMKPMDFVVPDQFVDRTNKAREESFFSDGIVAHISFADPVSPELTNVLINACKKVGVKVHEKGTYINMEGPQFSTRAESNLYRQWGMDIIGMTNMTEAKLAREAEIAYASLCSVTDYDCWQTSHESVTLEMIINNLNVNIANAKKILKIAVPQIGNIKYFAASEALKNAIVTSPRYITEHNLSDLRILIQKYIKHV